MDFYLGLLNFTLDCVVRADDMHHLEQTERMMVSWMCSASLKNRVSSEELNRRLDIVGVADVVRHGRLRWFGHLERKGGNDWVSTCRNIEVVGIKCRGRSRKTWGECVRQDLDLLSLKKEWAKDRAKWRGFIWGTVKSVQTW